MYGFLIMKKSTSKGVIVTLVLIAAVSILRFLLTESVSAKQTMFVVPALLFTALIIHGATYSGKKS